MKHSQSEKRYEVVPAKYNSLHCRTIEINEGRAMSWGTLLRGSSKNFKDNIHPYSYSFYGFRSQDRPNRYPLDILDLLRVLFKMNPHRLIETKRMGYDFRLKNQILDPVNHYPNCEDVSEWNPA